MIAVADSQDGQNFNNATATQAELCEYRIKRSALQYALLSAAVQVPQCLVYLNPITSANLQICADHMATLIRPPCMRIVETATASFIPNRLSLELVHPSESQGVRFDLQLDRDGEDVETARQNLQRTMASSPLFSDILELQMHSGSPTFLRPPHSILWSLPSLKYLEFGFGDLDKAARNSIFDTLSGVDGGSVICPQLDSLWIVFPDGVSPGPLIERTRAILVQRTLLGHPLKRLLVQFGDQHGASAAQGAHRELGGLVEHFALVTRCSTWARVKRENPWLRDWQDRVPLGCRAWADEITEHWPGW